MLAECSVRSPAEIHTDPQALIRRLVPRHNAARENQTSSMRNCAGVARCAVALTVRECSSVSPAVSGDVSLRSGCPRASLALTPPPAPVLQSVVAHGDAAPTRPRFALPWRSTPAGLLDDLAGPARGAQSRRPLVDLPAPRRCDAGYAFASPTLRRVAGSRQASL